MILEIELVCARVHMQMNTISTDCRLNKKSNKTRKVYSITRVLLFDVSIPRLSLRIQVSLLNFNKTIKLINIDVIIMIKANTNINEIPQIVFTPSTPSCVFIISWNRVSLFILLTGVALSRSKKTVGMRL